MTDENFEDLRMAVVDGARGWGFAPRLAVKAGAPRDEALNELDISGFDGGQKAFDGRPLWQAFVKASRDERPSRFEEWNGLIVGDAACVW